MFNKIVISLLVFVGASSAGLEDVVVDQFRQGKARTAAVEMQLQNSVVVVQNGTGHGTGFFIEDDLIITNNHVIAGAEVLIVQTYDGRQYPVKIVGNNKDMDLALLRVIGVKGRPLELSKYNARIGSPVFMLGHGSYDFYTLTAGTAGRLYPFVNTNWKNNQQLLKIKAIGGFSGSPVIDINTRKVVGVLAGGSNAGSLELGIMVPVMDLIKFLKTGRKVVDKVEKAPRKEKVVVTYLTIPAAAISKEQVKPLFEYCKKNSVQIKRKDDIIIFEGEKRFLLVIADFILRGGKLT